MNCNALLNTLTTTGSGQRETKSYQKTSQRSFESYYETEISKVSNEKNQDYKKIRAFKEPVNEKTNQLNKSEYKNEDVSLKEQINSEGTKTNKPDEGKKVVKEEKNALDQKEIKMDVDKETEELLQNIAQIMGISVDELKSILENQKLDVSAEGKLIVSDIMDALSTAVRGQHKDDEKILGQIKELLEKHNAAYAEEQAAMQEDIKTDSQIEVTKVKTNQSEGTSKPLDTQSSEQNNKTEIKTLNEVDVKDNAGNEQPVEMRTQSETAEDQKDDTQNEEGQEIFKAEVKTAVKVEDNTKVNLENLMQTAEKSMDVEQSNVEIMPKQLYKTSEQVIKQIIDKAAVTITADKTEMVLNLKPDHLGKLTLKVATENGMVTAEVVAENLQVKEIIETNLNVLRDTLAKQGISVQQFSVSVGQDSWKRAFNQGNPKSFTNSGSKKQEIGTTAVSAFGYQSGQQSLIDRLWPNSTISYSA